MTINLKSLPQQPGIYRFYDSNTRLLYIGKAVNLRNRVKSYFQKSNQLTPAKQLMVLKIKKIDYTVVSNETEALLLEANLIKKYQPPFNIDLKDDKSWLYIVITNDKFPKVIATRNLNIQIPISKKIPTSNVQIPTSNISHPASRIQPLIYGPYTSAGSVRQTMKLLRKLFPYYTTDGPMIELGKKIGSKFHLGRYLGEPEKNLTLWLEKIKQIKQFLTGQTHDLEKHLAKQMAVASKKQNYELAAKLRDQWQALTHLSNQQKVVSNKKTNDDYLGIYSAGEKSVITILKIRQGKLLDQLNFNVKNTKQLTDAYILQEFVEFYYQQTSDKPKIIYSPLSIINYQLSIISPNKGAKKKLLDLAAKNAEQYLTANLASFEKKQTRSQIQLAELKKILHLNNLPNRLEAYDISNTQGNQSVGSMVVATNGQLDKSQYRRFKIKSFSGINDPRSIAEVIARRLNNNWPRPDLMLIDGGPTQLNAAQVALKMAKADWPVISLAKKNEEIYLPGQTIPIRLPKFSPGLQLLQVLRDEAHRFAISYHRKLRSKNLISK